MRFFDLFKKKEVPKKELLRKGLTKNEEKIVVLQESLNKIKKQENTFAVRLQIRNLISKLNKVSATKGLTPKEKAMMTALRQNLARVQIVKQKAA